jgi:hypothetical protein
MWELERSPDVHAGPVRRLRRLPGSAAPAWWRPRRRYPCPVNGLHRQHRVYPGRIDVATADAVVASHPDCRQRPDQLRAALHRSGAARGALRNGTPFLDLPALLLRLRQSLCAIRVATGHGPGSGRRPTADSGRSWWRSSWCSRAWPQRQHQCRACAQRVGPAEPLSPQQARPRCV